MLISFQHVVGIVFSYNLTNSSLSIFKSDSVEGERAYFRMKLMKLVEKQLKWLRLKLAKKVAKGNKLKLTHSDIRVKTCLLKMTKQQKDTIYGKIAKKAKLCS